MTTVPSILLPAPSPSNGIWWTAGGGYFRIFNAASNLVLQTDNGTPAKVTLAPPSASPFQLWQFNYQTHFPKKGAPVMRASTPIGSRTGPITMTTTTGDGLASTGEF